MKQRCYQYLFLISVVIGIHFTVTSALPIGLKCLTPVCRLSVLITIKCPNDCKPIGIGSVLNDKWILTAHVVVIGIKSAKEENMIVIGGDQKPIDQLNQYPVSNLYVNDDSKQIKFPKTVALLKLENSIKFGPYIGEVIFAFEHAKKHFCHCELISITIDDRKVVTKSKIPVEVLFKGQRGCPTQDDNLVCVFSLLRHKSQRRCVNPCEEKTTIGSTLMCDLGLEGIFIGNENGKGCDPLPSSNQNRAIYFIRPTDPNVIWIEIKIRPNDEVVTDFTDDLFSIMSISTSTKFPIPDNGESSTSSSSSTSSTASSSSAESSSINTGIIGASTIGPSKNATPGSNTTLPSLEERVRKWKNPKCSSGFRHEQFISIVLCIAVCKYVI